MRNWLGATFVSSWTIPDGGGSLSAEAAATLRRLEREDFVFADLDPRWAQSPKK